MKRKIIFALAMLIPLVGCSMYPDTESQISQEESSSEEQGIIIEDSNAGEDTVPEEQKTIINEAAWGVYWDADPVYESGEYSQYNELVMFGCIYSEDNTLFIPEKLDELISNSHTGISSDNCELYLSFINDVMHSDGSSTQKSTDFLQNVLSDAELSDKVIDDMIDQTQAYGFDGIELDFENIHKCNDIWDEYLNFVSKLYNRASASDLKLRVILSVSTPVDDLDFIEGPQYVVMCYNLHGNHSGPGPKADEEFLKKTYDKFKSIDAGYALANGGFEWGPDDKTLRSLTSADAEALAKEQGADMTRDNNGVLSYSYESEDGKHTVFFGDGQTITRWSEFLLDNADSDIRINLWRLE